MRYTIQIVITENTKIEFLRIEIYLFTIYVGFKLRIENAYICEKLITF